MMRRIVVLAVILGLWGCGSESDIIELKAYVKSIQKFADYNQRVENYIAQFDDPSREVAQADLDESRRLLDEYAAAVAAVADPDESGLRNIQRLYARSFNEARRLSRDQTGIETGDLRRQAHSIAIGLRSVRRDVETRVYPSIEVLLMRREVEGEEWKLVWPEATR